MPELIERRPPVYEVYQAFDTRSLRVFRNAMDRSRGGVVRVSDLLAALAEREAGLLGDVLPPNWRPRPQSGSDERLVPMSNEPELREVLATAYRLGCARAGGPPPRITPALLWGAVVLMRHLLLPVPSFEILSRLGLEALAAPQVPVVRQPPERRTERHREMMRNPSAVCPDELLDTILNCWLRSHAADDEAERSRALAGLAEQVRRLERLPDTAC